MSIYIFQYVHLAKYFGDKLKNKAIRVDKLCHSGSSLATTTCIPSNLDIMEVSEVEVRSRSSKLEGSYSPARGLYEGGSMYSVPNDGCG